MRKTWILTLALTMSLAAASIGLAQTTTQPSSPTPVLREATPESGAPATTQQPAQGQGKGQTSQPANKPTDSFLTGPMFYVLMGALLLMWLLSSRSRKKQENKRKEMLSSLKKGDKVTTIGGVMGTVIEAREDEVVIKVDETNNTRMKFARWAIRGVGEEGTAEEQKK